MASFDIFMNNLLSIKQSINFEYNKLSCKQIALSKDLKKESDKLTNDYNAKLLREQEKTKQKTIFEEKFINADMKYLPKLYSYEKIEGKLVKQNSNYKFLSDFINDLFKLYSILIGYYNAKKNINSEINKLENEISELEYIIKLIEQEDYGKDYEEELDNDSVLNKASDFVDLQNYIYQVFYIKFADKFYQLMENSQLSSIKELIETNINGEENQNQNMLSLSTNLKANLTTISKKSENNLFNKLTLFEIVAKINNFVKNKINIINKNSQSENNSVKKTRNNQLNNNNSQGNFNSNNCDLEFNKKVDSIKKSSIIFYNEKGIGSYMTNLRKATVGILNPQV